MRMYLEVISIVMLTSACTQAAQRSDIQHTFAQTRRAPTVMLETCQQSVYSDPVLAAAQSYVANLAHYIMQKNSQTFSDIYDPTHFCVEIQNDPAVNAYANAERRSISIFTGLLEVMPNDAAVAAVVAHELAHVTMHHVSELEHVDVESEPLWIAEGVPLKAQYFNLQDQEDSHEAKIQTLIDSHAEDQLVMEARMAFTQVRIQKNEVSQRLTQLREKFIGHKANNWKEEEADDVSLEFFLRANFAPVYFVSLFEYFGKQEQQDIVSCEEENKTVLAERGVNTHPAACWRHYNATVLEMTDHADDYRSFIAKAVKTDIMDGQLKKIQDMLKARPVSKK